MKALSIHPYYALMIAEGFKTIECRTWKTNYRGDIVICSTAKKYRGTIPSHALCVAKLVDIVPFERKHMEEAMMDTVDYDSYAWILEDVRYIEPVYVKGRLGLWNFDDKKIKYIPEEEWLVPADATDEEYEEIDRKFIEKYWADITI